MGLAVGTLYFAPFCLRESKTDGVSRGWKEIADASDLVTASICFPMQAAGSSLANMRLRLANEMHCSAK